MVSPSVFPLYTPLLSPTRATCYSHLILLDFITRTILGEEYISLNSSLCSFLHSLVTSSLLDPNILLNTAGNYPLKLQECTESSQGRCVVQVPVRLKGPYRLIRNRTGDHSAGVKRSERKVDHSHLSSAEVMNKCSSTSSHIHALKA